MCCAVTAKQLIDRWTFWFFKRSIFDHNLRSTENITLMLLNKLKIYMNYKLLWFSFFFLPRLNGAHFIIIMGWLDYVDECSIVSGDVCVRMWCNLNNFIGIFGVGFSTSNLNYFAQNIFLLFWNNSNSHSVGKHQSNTFF